MRCLHLNTDRLGRNVDSLSATANKWVALDDAHSPVGVAVVWDSRMLARSAKPVHLDLVYVLPGQRRKGIATALYREACADMEDHLSALGRFTLEGEKWARAAGVRGRTVKRRLDREKVERAGLNLLMALGETLRHHHGLLAHAHPLEVSV